MELNCSRSYHSHCSANFLSTEISLCDMSFAWFRTFCRQYIMFVFQIIKLMEKRKLNIELWLVMAVLRPFQLTVSLPSKETTKYCYKPAKLFSSNSLVDEETNRFVGMFPVYQTISHRMSSMKRRTKLLLWKAIFTKIIVEKVFKCTSERYNHWSIRYAGKS